MSEVQAARSTGLRSFLRHWLPLVILLLGSMTVTALWIWPSESTERAMRLSFTLMAGMLTVLLLAGWFWLFSGFRLLAKLAVTLVLVLGVGLSVRGVHFSGDMKPILEFRWNKTRDEILEAQRRTQTGQRPQPYQAAVDPITDYPEYRGRLRDGIVIGPALERDWSAHPPRLLWKQPIGKGYAGFAVAGNAAVTIEQRRDQEAVVCYDTATGRERWVFSYPANFQEPLGGPGPRATPTIADGAVYSLGAEGQLVCFDLATGQDRWSVNILENDANVQWAMSGSPLVYDQVVVVNPGAQTDAAKGHALAAYDRTTGKLVWSAGAMRAGYSSPMLATLAGKRQIVLIDGQQVAGYDDQNGRILWSQRWNTMNDINVAQPLVLPGDRLFISSAYGVGSNLLQVSESAGKWSVTPVWPKRSSNLRCKFSSPVVYQGYIYGLDDGILTCIDQETGKRRWRAGDYGNGQLLLTEDLLLILSETGQLVLVQATPEEHRQLGSIPVFSGRTWNYPALAGGKAYLRNDEEMACYDLVRQR